MVKGSVPICGLLLAGGEGRRFGGDKLMAPLADGTPVAVAAARGLAAGVDRVLAITRPGRETLSAALREAGCDVIADEACQSGMGASIAAGVGATAHADGWMILPADMPAVEPASVVAVREGLNRGNLIVRPCYQGQPGHPVGFAAALGGELRALEGDAGGRRVVARHRGGVAMIPVADAGVIIDIDTPADLHRLPTGGK